MYISQQLKKKNIAEYLLYMWQVEDLIRANGCDMERIRKNIIEPYPATDGQKEELARWYEDLINIIVWLTDLHLRLLRSPKFPYYSAAYYKVLPFIVELRAKGGDKDVPELETCFDAMYGVLMLRLQKKEISEETMKAVKAISDLLAMLAGYYIKDKEGDLELD